MQRDPMTAAPGLPAKNLLATPVPPYGLVALLTSVDGVRTVGPPAEDDDPFVFVNGGASIPQDCTGGVTFQFIGPVAYDPADGTPAIGEEWGVKADDFRLRSDRKGFRISGEPDGSSVVATRIPPSSVAVDLGVGFALTKVYCDSAGQLFEDSYPFYTPGAEDPPTGTNTVSGTVTIGGIPQADVEVHIQDGNFDWVGVTDADGEYEATNLPGGWYAVFPVFGSTIIMAPEFIELPPNATVDFAVP